MEIADLQHGKILTIDVIPVTPVRIDTIPRDRQELALVQLGDYFAFPLSGRTDPVLVQVADSIQRLELQQLFERNAPFLCWLVHVRSDHNQVQSLTIQVHEFSERLSQLVLVIGLDEKLISDMERQLARRFSVEAAAAWLAGQFFIPPSGAGDSQRALLVGQPHAASQADGAFRILGGRYALDV